jgi:hypothetical protein
MFLFDFLFCSGLSYFADKACIICIFFWYGAHIKMVLKYSVFGML